MENKYNFTGLSFPTTINQIDIFEKNNPGVSVNVYGLDEDNIIFPRHVIKEIKADHTDLLLLSEMETSEDAEDYKINSHYCWIKNFEKLLRAQLTKHNNRIIIIGAVSPTTPSIMMENVGWQSMRSTVPTTKQLEL